MNKFVTKFNINKLISTTFYRFTGFFDLITPITLVRDPECIKKLGVKDFDHFIDHRKFVPLDDPGDSLFANSLFLLTGQKWRDMRATLSPAFTGSKMRQMFEHISVCGQNVTKYYQEQIKTNGQQVLEMKDTFTRFANDVIATSAFGFDVDSFRNRDNEFYQLGKGMTNFNSPMVMMRFLFMRTFPRIAKNLGVDFISVKWANYFKDVIMNTFETRDKNNIVRHDMVNILLQIRKGQQVKDQVEEKEETGFSVVEESDVGKKQVTRKWTDNELISQSFLFFVAGFDTVSTAMTFLSYELSLNPEIQQRLFEEIREVDENLEGKAISYDLVMKMQYLDMVVSESLRLWPPAPFVDRFCVKDYTYEDEDGLKFTIEKGQTIWFPIVGLHHDPKYYHNPEKFDPERFSPENRGNINRNAYLPFGVGPRNCIGSRFALMEVKIAMYYLLLNFSFEVTEQTEVPVKLANTFGGLANKNGVYLELKLRK